MNNCPYCKTDIDHLLYRVRQTCLYTLWETTHEELEDVSETDNTAFFCPKCQEKLRRILYTDTAVAFLRGRISYANINDRKDQGNKQ